MVRREVCEDSVYSPGFRTNHPKDKRETQVITPCEVQIAEYAESNWTIVADKCFLNHIKYPRNDEKIAARVYQVVQVWTVGLDSFVFRPNEADNVEKNYKNCDDQVHND